MARQQAKRDWSAFRLALSQTLSGRTAVGHRASGELLVEAVCDAVT